jgi:hypothetical protein
MAAAGIRALPIDHARRTNHPPTFADFLRLCLGSSLGNAVSEEGAFTEACAASSAWDLHVWSSAPVYHAAAAVGAWSLRQLPENHTRPRFLEAYRNLQRRQHAGESLHAPPTPRSQGQLQPALRRDKDPIPKSNRQRVTALSRALLELPDDLRSIATEALKCAQRVETERLLPLSLTISAESRSVLIEYCCRADCELGHDSDESTFSPPAL